MGFSTSFGNILRGGTMVDVSERVYLGDGSVVDAANGNYQLLTLTQNETPTFNIKPGQSVTVHVAPGAFVWTMTNVAKWRGPAPSSFEALHAVEFYNLNGEIIGALGQAVS